MDSIIGLLHLLLAFLVQVATLIVNFLVSMLELILAFIQSVAGQAH